MKRCFQCSTENPDEVLQCRDCGSGFFYAREAHYSRTPPRAGGTQAPPGFKRAPRRLRNWLLPTGLLLAVLMVWSKADGIASLRSQFAKEERDVLAQRAEMIAASDRDLQSELSKMESDVREHSTNQDWLSGAAARQAHDREWAARLAHDSAFARTPLEKNLLAMKRWGADPTLVAQEALEKVALLASPRGSRIEVAGGPDGYQVRVAYMMSQLSENEAGAVTKHHTTQAMRAEIQELSARVMRDLYQSCGSRGIRSIVVSCNHTLLDPIIPLNSTPEEKDKLSRRALPKPTRLYRVNLDQAHARSVVDWRRVSLSRILQMANVEYDGLTRLIIRPGGTTPTPQVDAPGELEF